MSTINFSLNEPMIDTYCAFCNEPIQGRSKDFECINEDEKYSKYCVDPLYNYYRIECPKCSKSFGTAIIKSDDRPTLNFWKGKAKVTI